MKILQITAAYKPAYIYGGPTMSVAKLCETLVKSYLVHRPSSVEITTNPARLTGGEQTLPSLSAAKNVSFDLEVFTTTANGKTELNVTPNKSTEVDGVKVTYFKRLTKDNTHFSPILLWRLRKECINSRQKNSVKRSLSFGEGWGEEKLIIHIHAWWNLVSILSCAIAKWYHVPVILSPRGMLTTYTTTNRNSFAKQIIHQILGKSLLKYCHIHVTSEKEKRDVLSIITPKSITVIPNLVELESESSSTVHRLSSDEVSPTNNSTRLTGEEQRATDNKQSSIVYRPSFDEELPTNNPARLTGGEQRPFKLIFLSRIEEKKGLELLFEALSSISFEWSLTIAGSGEEKYVESLKTKAERLKLNDKINWIGQVKNEYKFKLLAEHDLMVLTSYNENFANVVIESLSVGTAVLLSNEVGLADYVEEKKLGWITDITPENIKKNIITAFESVSSRTLIREKAPQLISKDFDSKSLIKKYFTLYSKLIHGRL